MKHNKPDDFENFIKQSLDNYEVDFDPFHWKEMDQKLNNTPGSPSSGANGNILGFKGLIAGGIIAAGSLTYFLISESPSTDLSSEESNPVIIETTAPETEAPGLDFIFPENENTSSDIQTPIKKQTIIKSQEITLEENSDEGIINFEVATTAYSLQDIQPEAYPEENLNISDEATASVPPVTLPAKPQSESSSGEKYHFDSGEINSSGTSGMNSLNADFEIIKPDGCLPQAKFTPVNQDENLMYSWDFGNGMVTNEPTPFINFPNSGSHHITLTISSKENPAIKATQSKKVNIGKSSKPASDFDFRQFSAGMQLGADFSCKSNDAVEWLWSFGDNTTSTEKNPRKEFSKGVYPVQLIVKNKDGCSDTTRKFIKIEENNPLLAPNAFSPNGDGQNDTFMPKALESISRPFELSIYDRRGNLVFRTNHASNPWDGSSRTGENYTDGTMFRWEVRLDDENGKKQLYVGNVSIFK